MRIAAGVMMVLVASSAAAAPQTLVAEVEYDFNDQNGFGWARVAGKVTVTLTFAGKAGSLKISGTRRWVDGRVAPTTASGMDTSNKWEGPVVETYPLFDVVHAGGGITFKLDPVHDHLAGSCAPTKVTGLARTTLHECTITGFKWHAIASLPELHHPIVLDANLRAKAQILNSMTGKAKPGQGKRAVSEAKRTPEPSRARR